MAMKSAAPTARRELTKRKIERRKNRPINFFSVTALTGWCGIGASESRLQRSGLDCVPLCVGDQEDLTAAFAHWSLPHPSECGRWIVAFSRFRFNGTMRSRRTVEGPRKWRYVRYGPPRHRVLRQCDSKARRTLEGKILLVLRRTRLCRANRSYRGSCRLARLSLGCGPRRGSLTVLVHTPYSEARCIHAHTCIS
ncbi:hypothetical protein HDV62DRAFT_37318 [Trichoderma sp. SZMC 28011]